MLTFADHITTIESSLSPALFSTEALREVKQLCRLFPLQFSGDFGFEARLGDPAAHCDFFFGINKRRNGEAKSDTVPVRQPFHSGLRVFPVWERLDALFREWEQSGTPLHREIEQFWLEFDYLESSFYPVPNVFFQINKKDEILPQREQAGRLLEALDSIYQLLFDIAFPAPLTATLLETISALPRNALVYQTGFMIPRKTEAIRLILTRITPAEMVTFLKETGWPGEIEVVEELLTRYVPLYDYPVFNLYIGQSVLPFLGIELYFREMAQPNWEPRWQEAFRLYEKDGLMLPGKKKGLLAFCGKKSESLFLPVNYFSGLNHVKLVYKKGLKPECKAYFGTMIRENSFQ